MESILGGGAPRQGLLFAGRAFLVGRWVDMSGQHRTSKERKNKELTQKNSIRILVEHMHHVPHNVHLPSTLALTRDRIDNRHIDICWL